jgi:diguanylate cyclase (GGDEF)-like protein
MVDGEVPAILALSSLTQRSTQLVASAPPLLFAEDQLTLSERIAETIDAEQTLKQAIRRAHRQLGNSTELQEIETSTQTIGQKIDQLAASMEQSLTLRRRYLILAEQIDVLQQEYRVLVSLLSTQNAQDLRFLTETNRVMATLGEVWQVREGAQIQSLRARLDSAFAVLDPTRTAMVQNAAANRDMIAFIDRLDSIARGDGNIFTLKENDLAARRQAAETLAAIAPMAKRMNARLSALSSSLQRQVTQRQTDTETVLRNSNLILVISSILSLIVAVVIAWRYVGASVVGRLNRLATSMHSIAEGNLSAPIPIGGRDELSDMARALVVFRDALAHLRHLATHDTLTGVANRRLVEEKLSALLADGAAHGTVIFINLRGFKDVNDTFGHTVGDQMLLAVADRLRWVARSTDSVGRLGGDDFVLLVPGLASLSEVEIYLEGMEAVLSAPIPLDVIEIDPHPSVGIARYPADGSKASELLQRAEMAMRRADTQPRPVCFYSQEMGAQVQQRQAIRADLRHAIEGGQLELHYQPKIDLRGDCVAGMEALVRWNHPERGRINPIDFIPIAEQSGLILPLGEWVLVEGCRQAKRWRDAGFGDLRVAVNMSPVQVLCQDVVSLVRQTLDETGLPPHLLEIEITEGVLMQEEARALQRLRALRDLGVHLAIDDFGTGYSSLSYLRTLPVTCLKIDQSFVRHLTENDEDARLNRVIIGMAHDFGLEVVAEGIETAAHADFLRVEGCDLGQGYFYARPLDVAGFTSLLTNPPRWLGREEDLLSASAREASILPFSYRN